MMQSALLGALANVVILVLLPLVPYVVWHRWRHKRPLAEIARRAGLVWVVDRYLGICGLLAVLQIVVVLVWSPDIEALTREGSAQASFVGLGLTGTSFAMALLYGMVKTGFAEEFLFRGLIAGSLSRRLSLPWANLLQATIFLLPHLLILAFAPELWWLVLFVLVIGLVLGWVRIRSGSILGPWLLHGSLNSFMALYVALRTVG